MSNNIEKYSKVKQQVMNLIAILEEFDRMKGMAKAGAIPGVARSKTLKLWEEEIAERFWSLATAERQYVIDCRTGNYNAMLRWSANHYRQYPADAELMCDLIRSCDNAWVKLADLFHYHVDEPMTRHYPTWSQAKAIKDKATLDRLLIQEDPLWWLKALHVVHEPVV